MARYRHQAVACASVALLGLLVVGVHGLFMPQLLRADNFHDKVTSGGRWFVQFHDPTCEACKVMTPRFRQVAKHFVSDPTTRFGKFNCEAEYNERFCEVHEVVYMPTYVLFDEYRTTGHRFNPPNVPSPDEMRMWLSETLRVSNATHDLPPILQVDMDLSRDWRHEQEYQPPEEEELIIEEVHPDGMSFIAPKSGSGDADGDELE